MTSQLNSTLHSSPSQRKQIHRNTKISKAPPSQSSDEPELNNVRPLPLSLFWFQISANHPKTPFSLTSKLKTLMWILLNRNDTTNKHHHKGVAPVSVNNNQKFQTRGLITLSLLFLCLFLFRYVFTILLFMDDVCIHDFF